MHPTDDEIEDLRLRAELRAELEQVFPPAPRWEALPWHVRPPWPRRIMWARRAALATGLLFTANVVGRELFATREAAPTGVTAQPTPDAPPAPPVQQTVSTPDPPTPAPPAPKSPEQSPLAPSTPAPDAPDDALVMDEPEDEAPGPFTRGGSESARAIAFAVRVVRGEGCERMDSTQLSPGQSLCFRISSRPAGAVSVMVEGPDGTRELTRLHAGPERVLASLPSGALFSFTPAVAGRYRFYAVPPGEPCGDGCHSVTLDVAP